MKVSATSSTSAPGSVSRSRGAGSNAPVFAADKTAEAHAPAPAVSANAVASVDAILALQSLPDVMTGRAKAVKRADTILDLLEQIRIGLLEGGVPKPILARLVRLVQERPEGFEDPQLAAVLADIDLRAQVELAKLNQDF